MKFVVVILSLAVVAHSRSIDYEDALELTTAYNYHERYGIPLGEAIRKAEEAELKEGNSTSRVAGGSLSSIGQFPYYAGLVVHSPRGQAACGGSLLSVNRVLTAAHCWWDGRTQATSITVVLASLRLFNGGVRLDSRNVVVDQGWNTRTLRNDIAMIRLPRNVALSNTINTIATPSGYENLAGMTATASGHGVTRHGAQLTTSTVLRHVQLLIIQNDVCARTPNIGSMVHASHVCTSGRGGVGVCDGDSGGPLVVTRNGRRVLVGLTSFGHRDGCQAGHPDVFTRLTAFALFIRMNL